MLIFGFTGHLTVTPAADRARHERERKVVSGVDAAATMPGGRVCSAKPPRCDPAKDSPARTQEDDVGQNDGEYFFEGAFSFGFRAEITRVQCRVFRKLQRLSQVCVVVYDTSNHPTTLIREDRFDVSQIEVLLTDCRYSRPSPVESALVSLTSSDELKSDRRRE